MTIPSLYITKELIAPDPSPKHMKCAALSDPQRNRPAGLEFVRAKQQLLEHYWQSNVARVDLDVQLRDLQVVAPVAGERFFKLRTLEQSIELRKTGMQNLCSIIGAPFDFVSELPALNAVRDLNYMIWRAPNKMLKLRTAVADQTKQVRAIVGSRYAAHDLPQLLSTVEDALGCAGILRDAYVMEAYIGKTTRIWLSLAPQMRGADGFPISPGIKIRNGESGNSSISIDPGFLRTICTNGLIHHREKLGTRAKHTGNRGELATNIAYALPGLFDQAYQMTTAANLAGSVYVTANDAERRLANTKLNKKQRSYVARVAMAEAMFRKEAAEAGAAWHDAEPRDEHLEPVTEEVYKELAERHEEGSRMIAADIMNGMTQLAQNFGPHQRQRTERAAHGLLYDSEGNGDSEQRMSLQLTETDQHKRTTPFHSRSLNSQCGIYAY